MYLAVPGLSCSIWDLGSLTRGRTQAPCLGSLESQPLDHERSPQKPSFTSSLGESDVLWMVVTQYIAYIFLITLSILYHSLFVCTYRVFQGILWISFNSLSLVSGTEHIVAHCRFSIMILRDACWMNEWMFNLQATSSQKNINRRYLHTRSMLIKISFIYSFMQTQQEPHLAAVNV